MSNSNLPSIQLKSSLGRGYISGYPGIPATNALTPRSIDPLISLPLKLREASSLQGSVEVRSGKASSLKAKYLRIELEKIEVIPSTSGAIGRKEDKGEGIENSKFVELIGLEPEILWSSNSTTTRNTDGKKVGKEREFTVLPDGNYDFKILLPEGLPPSIKVDGSGSGISYRLVATAYIKGKKSFFRSTTKTVFLTSQAPIILNKLDKLPTWPIYSPILRSPPFKPLEWTNKNSPTTGETKSTGNILKSAKGEEVKLRMVCFRESRNFGPGDLIRVRIEIHLEGKTAIKLTRLEMSVKEFVSFKFASPTTSRLSTSFFNPPPTINTIFSTSPSTSTSADSFTSIVYPDELASFDVSHPLPSFHSRTTVTTGKHIDVLYRLDVKATIEGFGDISIEDWNLIVGEVGRKDALRLMKEIGYVDGLCQRGETWGEINKKIRPESSRNPSPRNDSRPLSSATLQNLNSRSPFPTSLQPSNPPKISPTSQAEGFKFEKQSPPQRVFTIHNADPEDEEEDSIESPAQTQLISSIVTIPPLPPPMNQVPESAEAEKIKLHALAVQRRDELQGEYTRRFSQEPSIPLTQSIQYDQKSLQESSLFSPTSNSASTTLTSEKEDSKRSLQAAKFEALRRKEAARIELERQNDLITAMELEESRQREKVERDRLELKEYRRRDQEIRSSGLYRERVDSVYNAVVDRSDTIPRHYSIIPPTAPPIDTMYDHTPTRKLTLSPRQRSPPATFSPTSNISQAASAFYAPAIANSSQSPPTMAEEKSNYLRALRQKEEERKSKFSQYSTSLSRVPTHPPSLPTPPHSPSSNQRFSQQQYGSSADSYSYTISPPPQPHYQHQSQYSFQPNPQAPQSQPSSVDIFNYSPDRYAEYETSQSSSSRYKTAAEEKAEQQARREAEEKGKTAEKESDDTLPVYQTRGGDDTKNLLSADEEKRELNAYYSAKAEVDAYRNRPAESSSRQQYYSEPCQPITEIHYQPQQVQPEFIQSQYPNYRNVSNYNYPPSPIPSAPSAPSPNPLQSINEIESSQDYFSPQAYTGGILIDNERERERRPDSIMSESSSIVDLNRDPSIAAGKRVARSSSIQYGGGFNGNEEWRNEYG